MSMITEQIKRLREKAEIFKESGCAVDGIVWEFHEAADTIEELSTKLQAANMERSSQFYHGGWVPCEECLPEENDVVLVQSSRRMTNEEHDFITIARYENTHFWSRFGWNPYANIIAWRPLPEEYREED